MLFKLQQMASVAYFVSWGPYDKSLYCWAHSRCYWHESSGPADLPRRDIRRNVAECIYMFTVHVISRTHDVYLYKSVKPSGVNPNWSDVYSVVHILTQGLFWPWSVSRIFPPRPCPRRGEGRGGGGGRAAVGLGDVGERATFCPRVVLTLLWGVGEGGGRAATGLGDGRSITFVGTWCLSKVKSDLAFLTWHN